MIPIKQFNNHGNRLEEKIVKYINDNLEEMVGVYFDYLNADDGFSIDEKLMCVLPRDYVVRKPVECRLLVDELYEIISSQFIRSYIKPKYEYLLYHIMHWWRDVCDNEEEYIPISLPIELREEIDACAEYISEENGRNIVIRQLEDFEESLL